MSGNVLCRQLDRDMVVGGYRLPKGTPLISQRTCCIMALTTTLGLRTSGQRFEATPCDASADPREPTGMMHLKYLVPPSSKLLTHMKVPLEVAVQ